MGARVFMQECSIMLRGKATPVAASLTNLLSCYRVPESPCFLNFKFTNKSIPSHVLNSATSSTSEYVHERAELVLQFASS